MLAVRLLLVLGYHHYRPALACKGKSQLTLPDVIVTLRAGQLAFISDPNGLLLPDETQSFDSWPRVIWFSAEEGPADRTLWGLWMIQLGWVQVPFCAKWKMSSVSILGKCSMGEQWALFFSFSLNSLLCLHCYISILDYLPLTTSIFRAHALCLLALNPSAMTETFLFLCLLGWNLLLRERRL